MSKMDLEILFYVLCLLGACAVGYSAGLYLRTATPVPTKQEAETPPGVAFSRIPTAEIHCEEPGEVYCRRYKVYRLTGID